MKSFTSIYIIDIVYSMDIYQLRYFLAVVETRNFSRAAERVFISQPTLSAGIKKLEQELDVILFNRGSRDISLTDAGRRFLPRARTVIYEVNAAKQEASGKIPSLRFQIGIPRALPIAKLSPLLADFRKTHPQAQIAIKEGTPEQLEKWLDEKRVDMIISTAPTATTGHFFEKLFTTKCVLAVPEQHTLSSRNAVPMQQLNRLDFIHRSHCLFETEITRTFAREGVNPHIIFRTDEDEKALSLVAAGTGLCVVPDILNHPGIEFISIDGFNSARTLGISWVDGQKTEITEAFRLFAISHNWQDKRNSGSNLEWAR